MDIAALVAAGDYRAAQAALGVTVDGIWGPRSRAAYEAWRAAQSVPTEIIPAAEIRALAVRLALGCTDIREEGGNNRGPQVESIQRWGGGSPGDAWCAQFVCWAHDIAARAHGCRLARRSGGCDRLAEITPSCAPQPGALVMRYAEGSRSDRAHVELVTGFDGVWIASVGGNTNGALSRDGSGVHAHPQFIRIDDPRYAGCHLPEYVR